MLLFLTKIPKSRIIRPKAYEHQGSLYILPSCPQRLCQFHNPCGYYILIFSIDHLGKGRALSLLPGAVFVVTSIGVHHASPRRSPSNSGCTKQTTGMKVCAGKGDHSPHETVHQGGFLH